MLRKLPRYIENMQPSDIRALAETAAFREVAVLREALWKHFARQMSLKVEIPVSKEIVAE